MNVFWFIPTHGDSRYLGTSKGARAATFDYFKQIAIAADPDQRIDPQILDLLNNFGATIYRCAIWHRKRKWIIPVMGSQNCSAPTQHIRIKHGGC